MKLGLIAVMLAGLVLTAGFASAYWAPGIKHTPKDIPEDYDTWVDTIDDWITEDRFDKMVDMHNNRPDFHEDLEAAIEEGDYDSWKEIMLSEQRYEHIQERHEEGMERWQLMKGTRGAFADGDYDAYVLAMEDAGLEPMPEDDFNTMVDLHKSGQLRPFKGKHR